MLNKEEINLAKLLRVLFLVLVDVLCVGISTFCALLLRFEFDLSKLTESGFLEKAFGFYWIAAVITVAVFALFRLYNSLWEFAGAEEFIRLVLASAVATTLYYIALWIFAVTLPRSFPLLFFFFLAGSVFCIRFSYRAARRIARPFVNGGANPKRRTMLIGAGAAGLMTLKELQTSSHSESEVLCIIDDDQKKHGTYMKGVKIFGGRNKIGEAVKKYGIEDVIFAIPTATYSDRKDIFDLCTATGCNVKTIPGLYELASGRVHISQIRNVQIEDLLGRAPVKIDMNGIENDLLDSTVMVTGGGGSIGSELCRQLAHYAIRRLIIVDIYENNAYDIQQEIKRECPNLELVVLIASVRDYERMEDIFNKYQPKFIFHAAAHKHVPLMEDSPCEAVKNNVFGTLNMVKLAASHGVKRFLLVSTDKAVNPTSVMGASKRICEMIVQYYDKCSPQTDFVAVRFGNVLGSNGSVIPLFKKQIEHGGPVTVTDPSVIRYFMTIPEAVSLILQAGAYAKGGEIFVLDMGEPVKIDDLARRMIRLSGYEPDVDIKVEYIGLRPGEKLYEELLMSEEGMTKTANHLIYIGKPLEFDEDSFMAYLQAFSHGDYNDPDEVKTIIKKIVPNYDYTPKKSFEEYFSAE